MHIIASFPHSGNHLVRFITEYITGRPTLGCYDNPSDIPIHGNIFPLNPGILDHVGGKPIGHKTHTVPEIRYVAAHHDVCGIIFLRRAPLEAILGSLRRRRHDFLTLEGRRDVRRLTRSYFDLADFVAGSARPTVEIAYEAITSPDTEKSLPAFDRLVAHLGPAVDHARADEMRADFDHFQRISATGTRRAWGGIRSNGDPHYHEERLGEPWTTRVRREIARYEVARTGDARHAD